MKKVLIIDDEELIRSSLRRVLIRNQFEVFEASDGDSGLKVWLEKKPDIILLDYMMPGITGLDILTQVPSELKGVVFVISAYVGEEERKKFIQEGVQFFYKKPFEDIFSFVSSIKEKCVE